MKNYEEFISLLIKSLKQQNKDLVVELEQKLNSKGSNDYVLLLHGIELQQVIEIFLLPFFRLYDKYDYTIEQVRNEVLQTYLVDIYSFSDKG